MLPRKTPESTQMNLLFCDSKPMMLPDDKQRELAIALADLLLNAAIEPTEHFDLRGAAETESATPVYSRSVITGTVVPDVGEAFIKNPCRHLALGESEESRDHTPTVSTPFSSGQPIRCHLTFAPCAYVSGVFGKYVRRRDAALLCRTRKCNSVFWNVNAKDAKGSLALSESLGTRLNGLILAFAPFAYACATFKFRIGDSFASTQCNSGCADTVCKRCKSSRRTNRSGYRSSRLST